MQGLTLEEVHQVGHGTHVALKSGVALRMHLHQHHYPKTRMLATEAGVDVKLMAVKLMAVKLTAVKLTAVKLTAVKLTAVKLTAVTVNLPQRAEVY